MPRCRALACLTVAGALVLGLAKTGDVRGDSALSAEATLSACPAGMVLVPHATVTLGAPDDADALPRVTQTMGPFCIDRTEVTVADYRACMSAGACAATETTVSFPGYGPPEPMKGALSRFCNSALVPEGDRSDRGNRAEHPMNCIDQVAAARYCTWRGGRLPDEAEWEYAARGSSPQRYPWGSGTPVAPGGALCWDRRATAQGTCAVGQFPAGASPVGALDMAGNVWEWTSSRTLEGSVVRGGGWTNFLPRFVSTTYRWPLLPATRLNCVGFRCVHDAHD